MRRDQLEHAIRTACQIIGHPAVIIVGSQAILGSFGEDELPVEATMSVEVDVLPISDNNTVTAELADLIEAVAGEWSPFEEQHGFSIDGVDLDTAVLPAGWRDRLVRVQNTNTAASSWKPSATRSSAPATATAAPWPTRPPAGRAATATPTRDSPERTGHPSHRKRRRAVTTGRGSSGQMIGTA